MQTADLKCIADIVCGKKCSCSNIDWYSVFGFLQLNRLAGRFYRIAHEKEISVPPRIMAQLQKVAEWQAERNRHTAIWVNRLSCALEQLKIPYAFLKGTVLVNADFKPQRYMGEYKPLYRTGDRVSNDIDLLIAPNNVGKVEKTLLECGFVQGYYDPIKHDVRGISRREILERRMNRGETVPFQKIVNCEQLRHLEIDVNFSLDYLPNGKKEILEKMLEHTRLYPMREEGMIRSLESVDFFIHLILHQYKEMRIYSMVMRGKDLEFYKLLDLYLMLQELPHEEIYHRICEYGIEDQASVVLKILAEAFDGIKLGGGLKDLAKADFPQSELVIDPTQKNRSYVWTAETLGKLCRFDHTGMLVETT